VAQLVDRLLYVGWGTGGIDDPVAAAQVSEAARDVEKNNAAVQAEQANYYQIRAAMPAIVNETLREYGILQSYRERRTPEQQLLVDRCRPRRSADFHAK